MRPISTGCRAAALFVLATAALGGAAGGDDSGAVDKEGKAIDPRHRNEATVKMKDPRYYVWFEDATGWNLRCAAMPGDKTKFEGTIAVEGGTIGKVRPIGLEMKGKDKDLWELDAERKTLTFRIKTRGGFDGFEFAVKGDRDTRVKFDLRQDGKPRPGKVFIGKEGEHPKSGTFRFAAKP